MKKVAFILIILSQYYIIAQKGQLQMKLYSISRDEYFVSASKKDSSFIGRKFYLKYKVINTTNDTICFNTIHFSYATAVADEKGVEKTNAIFGFFKLLIEDNRWNKASSYCGARLAYDEYKKMNNDFLYSFIKKIPPHDSIDENIKAICCPDCDKLNDVSFTKDYKIDEKYIKAQLKYNSTQKLYYYPKGKKYWKGKLESNIITF